MTKPKKIDNKLNNTFYSINGVNLPTSMNYGNWGQNVVFPPDNQLLMGVLERKQIQFNVRKLTELSSLVRISFKGKAILEFTDTKNQQDSIDSFTRVLSNGIIYIFKNGQLTLKKARRTTSFIPSPP